MPIKLWRPVKCFSLLVSDGQTWKVGWSVIWISWLCKKIRYLLVAPLIYSGILSAFQSPHQGSFCNLYRNPNLPCKWKFLLRLSFTSLQVMPFRSFDFSNQWLVKERKSAGLFAIGAYLRAFSTLRRTVLISKQVYISQAWEKKILGKLLRAQGIQLYHFHDN